MRKGGSVAEGCPSTDARRRRRPATVKFMSSDLITSSQAKELFIIGDERLKQLTKEGVLDAQFAAPVGNRDAARLYSIAQLQNVALRRGLAPSDHHCIEMRIEDLEDLSLRQGETMAAVHASLSAMMEGIARMEAAIDALRVELMFTAMLETKRTGIWVRLLGWRRGLRVGGRIAGTPNRHRNERIS